MNFHGIEAAIVNRDIGDLTGIKVKKIIFTEAGEGKGEVDMDNGLSKGGLQRCVCRPLHTALVEGATERVRDGCG